VYYGEYQPRLTRENMTEAQMVNISQEGALFECDKIFKKDELLTLEINLIGWQNFKMRKMQDTLGIDMSGALRVNATVVWWSEINKEKYQIGVQFANIRAHDRDILKEYISKRVIFEL
jgi:hypothetical protein